MAEELKLKIETAPFDARFPYTNQTKNCWQNYVDYHRCVKAKGEDYEPCMWFKKNFTILCPTAWVCKNLCIFCNLVICRSGFDLGYQGKKHNEK